MRRIILGLLLLISSPTFAQDSYKIQELKDIYLASDSITATRLMQQKGYTIIEPDEVSKVYRGITFANVVYARKYLGSDLNLYFDKGKIKTLSLKDSVSKVDELLQELSKSDLRLVNRKEGVFEVFTKKRLDYFFWYYIVDKKENIAMISIMRKHKGNKMFYNPK